MRTLALSLALALFAVTPTLALAQEAGKAETAPTATPAPAKADGNASANIDPAAEKLRSDAKAALKKVRDVSYKLKQTGGMMGNTDAVTGVVTLSFPETPGMGMPFDRYKIVINDDKGAPKTEWSTDGKTLFKIDHAAKKLLSMKAGEEVLAMPPQDIWDYLPVWFMEDAMQESMWTTVSLATGTDAEVGGVKCRVLTSVQEMALPSMGDEDEEGDEAKVTPKVITTQTKHFGADDMIPRKVEMGYKGVGLEVPDMKLVAEMADVKFNAGLKDTDFALKAPEGYASEEGTHENMGLPDPSGAAPELKAEVGKPALAFNLKDSKGNDVTLESLKGRVVLLDFWATWCGPCVAAMPAIQGLHEKFSDKPVSIIGVNTWEDKSETAIKFMEKKKFTYTLLLKGDDLAKEYGISGIPTLILIGKDGNVLHTGVGFGPGEEEHLAQLIEAELKK
jgi:thiol-disulfide isomerase/thioredoxin